MRRGAVFLDRDGTINRDRNYVGRPEAVELIDGAADAIRRLNEAGIPVVVVTNQSGIARGFFAAADYERVRERLDALLGERGARIDASYMCPHHPDFTGECDCRKPGPGLFRRAAADLGIDLARSFFIGDRLRDVAPAAELGGTGILVPSPETPAEDVERAGRSYRVARSLDEAVRVAIESPR